MKTPQALLCGALALFTFSSALAGTTYTATDKNVVSSAPPPPEPCAGPISYSNVELLYAYTDFDDNFGDGGHANGGRLNIEYSPMQNFYLTAGADFIHESDVDLWIVNGGIGVYYPITDNIHIALDGGILWVDVEFDDSLPGVGDDGDSDTGWYARPHLRGKWGCFEAHVGALYRDMGDFNTGDEDGRWAGFGKLYYHLNDSWDITAGVLFEEDITQWSGGVRWRF